MNVERIREKLGRDRGFRPFSVVTSSGNKYPVPHSEFIIVTPRTVVVANERGGVVTLDPLHIVGLEDIAPKSGPGGRRAKK
jgi:hypothetical protein